MWFTVICLLVFGHSDGNTQCLNNPILLTENIGDFTHPYDSGQQCIWIISGKETVKMKAEVLSSCGTLTIVDGKHSDLCDFSSLPPLPLAKLVVNVGNTTKTSVTSFSTSATIYWDTMDCGKDPETYSAFFVNWNIEKNTTSSRCDSAPFGVQQGMKGNIKNPEPHALNEHCVWAIAAPPGYRIKFITRVKEFVNCEFCEFLVIRDEFNLPMPLIYDWMKKYSEFTSPSNVATVHWIARQKSLSNKNTDFEISWNAVRDDTSCYGHPFYITGLNGTFHNPEYPNPYMPNHNCIWQIYVTPTNKIQLSAQVYSMPECNESDDAFENCDHLLIQDYSPIRQILSKSYINANVTTFANYVFVRWRTTSKQNKCLSQSCGFTIHWKAVTHGSSSRPPTHCGDDCFPHATTMQFPKYNLFPSTRSYGGTIYSPGFPGKYAANVKCEWQILDFALLAHKEIRYSVETYSLEDCFDCDYLHLLNFFTYEEMAKLYTSYTYYSEVAALPVIIKWKTDNSSKFHEGQTFGFRMNWHKADDGLCEGSPFRVNGTEGVIQVLNSTYPTNQLCEWHIQADNADYIELDVTTYGLDSLCAECDFLLIEQWSDQDGNTTSLVLRLFESNQKATVKINSSFVYILWKTDNFVSYNNDDVLTGFTVKWTAFTESTLTKESNSTWLTIVLSTIIPFVLLLIIILVIIVCVVQKRQKLAMLKKQKAETEEDGLSFYIMPAENFQTLLEDLGEGQLLEVTKRLEIDQKSLQLFEVVGSGNFGVVHRGQLLVEEDLSQQVAVKVVKSSKMEAVVELVKEAALMHNLSHPNIMKLIGIAIINETPHVIFPFLDNGNMKEFLQKLVALEGPSPLSTEQLLEFCQQICDGMQYMTERGYIHRDLAARNILVDVDWLVKISDFGLGRQIEEGGYYKCRAGESAAIPIRWLPPESFLLGFFDVHTDVWSFGVVCWEIFSYCENQPYHELNAEEIGMFIHNENRLEQPEACSEEIYKTVILPCWNNDRFSRPSFATLQSDIKSLRCQTSEQTDED